MRDREHHRPPLEDASFDGVLCSSAIEYVDDPDQSVQEFARVLRVGGLVLLSVPNRRSLLRGVLRLCHLASRKTLRRPLLQYLALSKHSYTPRQVEALQAKHRLSLLRLEYYGPLTARLKARGPLLGTMIITLARKKEAPG